jgi:hypothetical protein
MSWRRYVEVEIYRNALITAVYITEDTLKSLRLRLFDTEYSLEIGPALNGWQNNKVRCLSLGALQIGPCNAFLHADISGPQVTGGLNLTWCQDLWCYSQRNPTVSNQ